jgi:hypothetical protein
MDSKFKYHIDGTLPENDEVWVFGSNTSGLHYGGAAKVALDLFGAKMKHSMGRVGNSFAIPTVAIEEDKFFTRNIRLIAPFINEFVRYTHINPDLNFFCTAIGCQIAGFSPKEIAPFFKDCNTNVSFPDTWKEFLED